MGKWVSVAEKRQFLKWFLAQQQLKRKEAGRVLEYLLQHYHLLEQVTFTEEIRSRERTIVISSLQSEETGFAFHLYRKKIDDPARAIGELQANPADPVYIILHFHGKAHNQHYLQMLDSESREYIKHYKQFREYKKEAGSLIEAVLIETEKSTLLKQIDEALDQKNEQRFKQLVKQLQKLEAQTS
ncbi:YpiB family protein [Alkalihalobacillus oceani]|uniref:YpiB family protein n=1 Tax=Halalkalibacter oceani TaxID=1653776 RepID=UPI00203FA4DD|nr:YpiB family protein [Halalkalibacter oceani]MCM3760351.1 YpiB family protein [Halalkalibacter oceani]